MAGLTGPREEAKSSSSGSVFGAPFMSHALGTQASMKRVVPTTKRRISRATLVAAHARDPHQTEMTFWDASPSRVKSDVATEGSCDDIASLPNPREPLVLASSE